MGTRSEIPPGTLYMLILRSLARTGPMHGYGIAQFIQHEIPNIIPHGMFTLERAGVLFYRHRHVTL